MKTDTKKNLNFLKILSVDMIDAAKAGYPGISLGASSIIYTLFTEHLNIMPSNPDWLNHDRLVLSAAHASGLVYANMYMAGFDITLDDLKNFGKPNSKTPILNDMLKTKGIDMTTGPAGYGFSAAIGMAMGEKYYKSLLSKYIKGQKLVNHYIYCLISDGDIESGQFMEAASLAGLYNLGNLIVLYDSNNMTMDNSLEKSSLDDILKKFSSMGWQTDYVAEGSSVDKIDKAIKRAKRVTNKPSLIEIKTVIGKDSFNQNTNIVHDHPLTKDDLENLKRKYGFSTEKFQIDDKLLDNYRKYIQNRVGKKYKLWQEYHDAMAKYPSNEIKMLVNFADNKDIGFNIDMNSFKIQNTYQEEMTESNNKILNILADKIPFILGGSSDMASSCRVNLRKEAYFTPKNYGGRNIIFGVRETAMGSILSGISSYGFQTFGATHLRYAYSMLDDIKMNSLMNLPVCYIFTHDGFSNSKKGAVESSFEVLNILRNIPNVLVFRPSDINEIIGSWDAILRAKKTTCLVLSNEITHILKGSKSSDVSKGAYIIRDSKSREATIISSGFDVTLSLVIAEELATTGIDLRVVSVPCKEILDKMNDNDKNNLLVGKVIVIESTGKDIWCRYTSYDNIIGIDDVMPSGTALESMQQLGYDKESIKLKIKNILKK